MTRVLWLTSLTGPSTSPHYYRYSTYLVLAGLHRHGYNSDLIKIILNFKSLTFHGRKETFACHRQFQPTLLLLRYSAHLHICLEPTSSHVRYIVHLMLATSLTELGQSRGTCRSPRLHRPGRVGLAVIMSCTTVGCVRVACTTRCAGVSSTYYSCPPSTLLCPVPSTHQIEF